MMPSCLRLVHGGVAFFLPRVARIFLCVVLVAVGDTRGRSKGSTDRRDWVTREAWEPYSVRSGQTVLLGGNMGMSASDAAPLPRLGEIFFDVRGSSRSMRLSWYSNTGIAVFSIWQGGTCTGTFRLPIDDLTRLVDSLRRGAPGGQDDNSGPIALGGQRPRLAIGAAPAE